MTKLFYLKIVSFVFLLFVFSCNEKTVLSPNSRMPENETMQEDLTPTSAQVWFEKKYGSKNARLTASTKTPLWTYATQTKDKDGNTMILAPIATGESQQNFGIILNDVEKEKKSIKDKKLDESDYAVPQKLLMIKDKKGKIQTFLTRIVADYEYFNKSLYKDKKSQVKNNGNDFDGSVILFNWGQDQIVEAFRYKNGKLKGNLASVKNARVLACEVVGYTQYFPCNNARTSSETTCGTFLYIGYNCPYDGSSTVISTPTFFMEGGGGGYSSDIISSSYRANQVDNFMAQAASYGVIFNPDERLDFIDNFDVFLQTKDDLWSAITTWGNITVQGLEDKINELFLSNITQQERNLLAQNGRYSSYRVNLLMYAWNGLKATNIAQITMNGLGLNGSAARNCSECRGNAVKHAAWNIFNAHTFGSWLAQQLGPAHEIGQIEGVNKSMDLHNNAIGISLFNDYGIIEAIGMLPTILQNGLPNNPSNGFKFVYQETNLVWTKDYPNEN